MNDFNFNKKIKRILMKKNIRLSPSKSQYILLDKEILNQEVDVCKVSEEDEVVEIGAGVGNLTKLLAEKSKKVIAVENDKQLTLILKNELKDYSNVEILREDVLKLENSIFDNRKIVSNPPYHISSPILMKILQSKYKCCAITFQLEFGERLVASPGSNEYSRLTLRANYKAAIQFIRIIKKDKFYPVPKVDSVLLKIIPKEPIIKVDDEEKYFRLVNKLFNHKNQLLKKVIRNELKKRDISRDILDRIVDGLPFKEIRIRNLDHMKLKEIYEYLNNLDDELKIF